jgi:hypothetical protein
MVIISRYGSFEFIERPTPALDPNQKPGASNPKFASAALDVNQSVVGVVWLT